MTSDKDASVRLAALNGLLAPFKHKHDKRPATLQLKVEDMQNVCNKFLPRIAECTDDSQSLEVQDAAMELVVKLASEGFMDDFDDDAAWDRLNLKALDSDSTPGVRKNALYLVLDQLDVFDESDGRSVVNVAALTERQQIARINGIAQWYVWVLLSRLGEYRRQVFSKFISFAGFRIFWSLVRPLLTRSTLNAQTISYSHCGRCQSTKVSPLVGQRYSKRSEVRAPRSRNLLMKRPKL